MGAEPHDPLGHRYPLTNVAGLPHGPGYRLHGDVPRRSDLGRFGGPPGPLLDLDGAFHHDAALTIGPVAALACLSAREESLCLRAADGVVNATRLWPAQ